MPVRYDYNKLLKFIGSPFISTFFGFPFLFKTAVKTMSPSSDGDNDLFS